MRIWGGCYAICVLFCVYAYPMKERINRMYISSSKLFDPESIAGDYEFEDVSPVRLPEIMEEDLKDFEKGPTMKAITTRSKSKVVLLPLILEPEAEMLPPGYKGVKPPGVSHMELVFPKRQGDTGLRRATLRTLATDESSSKSDRFDQDDDAHYAASKRETQVVTADRDSKRITVFELGSKGDLKEEDKRANYTKAADARKSHSKNEDRATDYKDVERKGATYEAKDGLREAHNAAGYRNVYHKNEYKKDADFYDNRHQGGRFKKRGRYDEKYADAEDTYKKGQNKGFKLDEFETNKRKKLEKMRTSQETQDYAMTDFART